MDKGGLDSNHTFYRETSSASHYPQDQPEALDHRDALCHLSYQVGIMVVCAYRVLVRVEWNDTCQVLSMRSSTQWMIVLMTTMMKIMTSFRIHILSICPPITPHSSMLPTAWLPWLSLLPKPSLLFHIRSFHMLLLLPDLTSFFKQTLLFSFKRILLGITISEVLADSAKQTWWLPSLWIHSSWCLLLS